MRPDATSRLRMWGYCLVLTVLAFIQAPGRIVGDTKLDLVVDPGGFLARAAQLWDPSAAFGQIQNQAYGYFWPMGPFFWLGDALDVPAWVVQRSWWAVLLCLAFVGTVKVARALEIGRPWTHVVSGFAFALSAHVLTLLGPTSVEAWPTAWAPWVLLPLVLASREWSPRRGAALSALAVAMCGGVNAVAVSAVLPLGLLWVLTRERGRRQLQLLGWWVPLVALATLWWVVPLLLLGRYSVPFLDYIENAPITTQPTGLPDTLGGTSDWVAYIASADWGAGHLLGTTPFLLVNAAVIAGAGLAGIARRDNPHRQFLFLGVLVGLILVGFGYVGPLHGWWAAQRLELLDGGLAPFRNTHKFDVVLRLSLVLGISHFLTVLAESARGATSRMPQLMAIFATLVSVVGLAAPAYAGRLSPGDPFDGVPLYWRQAADYLGEAGEGVSLVVPASAFGDYLWGSPHDDVLQPLASAPWAVRNIIPLAQPGNVRFLDAVTEAVEEGRPSPTLASFLAANGVGRLVVRNDVSFSRVGSPDPVLLHQALDGSPGLRKVAEFGPPLGVRALSYAGGARVLANRGREAPYRAVEVYEVEAARGQVGAWTAGSVPVVAGDPAAGLEYGTEVLDGPSVLAGDRTAPFRSSPSVLTDGLRRREKAFTAVRRNESATMSPLEPWTLRSVEPNHRVYPDQDRFETRAQWVGLLSVDASSSQAQAAVVPPIRPDRLPAAAVDGARWTQWVSSGFGGAVGQWWGVRFQRPTYLKEMSIRAGDVAGQPVSRLRITTDVGTKVVQAPRPGQKLTYTVPEGGTTKLRVRALTVKGGGPGQHFALAEVDIPPVRPERFLATPDVLPEAPDQILLATEPDRAGCMVVGEATLCDDFWRLYGEESLALRRAVTVRSGAEYDAGLTATPRRGKAAAQAFARRLPVKVETSEPLSRTVRASGIAALDGDPGTAWVAGGGTPYLRLRWDRPRVLRNIEFDLSPEVPGALPEEVLLKAGKQRRSVSLATGGGGDFAPLRTDEVEIRFVDQRRALSAEQGRTLELPVAVGEVRFPGAGLPPVDPDRSLDLGCGTGPSLFVNGERERTRLVATLAMVMSGDALRATPCDVGKVALKGGTNLLVARRSRLVRAEEVRLTRGTASPTRPKQVWTNVERWSPTSRTVSVGERDVPTLLVVNENINAGWRAELRGRSLPAQRVNGWMQGWVVPPGARGDVVLRFAPNSTYHWALFAGIAGLVLTLVAAAVPARTPRQEWPGGTGDAPWLVAGTSLVAGGLLTGWVGLAGMAVALLVGTLTRIPLWVAFVAGGLVASSGVAMALLRADEFAVHSLLAQSLAAAGLAVATATFGLKGPRFFRRRKGRSST